MMGKERQTQKIIKYIRQDRPKRLKSFAKKHRIDLNSIDLEGGGNLLHICCAISSGSVLKYLLSEDVDGVHRDNFGNTPLHILVQRALGRLLVPSTSYTTVYEEMVVPYSLACPTALEKRDAAGKSAQDLIDRFLCLWEQKKDAEFFGGPSTERQNSDEDRWREKLRDECEDEYQMNGGLYEEDFLRGDEPEFESYDDWANRMDRMHYDQKMKYQTSYSYTRRPAPPMNEKHKSTSSTFKEKHESYQEKLRKAREQMKRKYKGHEAEAESAKNLLKQKHRKYEQLFNDILEEENSSVLELGFDDIPWPHEGSVAMVMDVLFVDVKKSDPVAYKKSLREQVLRWHPDKFEQKFGRRLKESDREKILLRVKEISQALNSLAEKI